MTEARRPNGEARPFYNEGRGRWECFVELPRPRRETATAQGHRPDRPGLPARGPGGAHGRRYRPDDDKRASDGRRMARAMA